MNRQCYAYPLTFTNFIIENFTLGNSKDYNGLFERFFTPKEDEVWSVTLFKEFEDGLITNEQLYTVMFISSAYTKRTMRCFDTEIPELEFSYMCASLRSDLDEAADGQLSFEEVNLVMIKYINILKDEPRERYFKNGVIPDDIFKKVIGIHMDNMFKSALYIMVKENIKKTEAAKNGIMSVFKFENLLYFKEAAQRARCFEFSFSDFSTLCEMGYNFNDCDEQRQRVLSKNNIKKFGFKRLCFMLSFINRMIDDIFDDSSKKLVIQTKIKRDIKFIKYIEN